MYDKIMVLICKCHLVTATAFHESIGYATFRTASVAFDHWRALIDHS
jgi:hypothetical protein